MEEERERMEQRATAVNLLTQKLLDVGKTEELRKASMDEAYQTKLLKEYNLI